MRLWLCGDGRLRPSRQAQRGAAAPDGDTNGLARYPGSSPVISWNNSGGAASDAILWILVTSGNGTGPVKLYAYQAVPPLPGQQFSLKWHDTTAGPLPSKFMVPTVI